MARQQLYGKGRISEVRPGVFRLELSGGKNPKGDGYLRMRETLKGTKRQAELRIEEMRAELQLTRDLLEMDITESDLCECGLTIPLAIQDGMNAARVKAHLNDFREKQANLRAEENRRITFSDWMEDYLSTREKMSEMRKSTLRKDRTHSSHLLGYLADKNLSEIDAELVEKVYADMRASGMGDETLLSCHGLLKRVMARAYAYGRIDTNPMDIVKRPERITEVEHTWLEPDEARRLCNLVTSGAPCSYNTLVYLALATGARLGELLGLQWEHLAKDGKGRPYIVIRQQHTRYNERTATKTSKLGNPKSRIIPLDSSTVELLHSWKSIQREQLNALGIEQGNGTPIITNRFGGWVTHSNFERWFRTLCVRNGFGKYYSEDGREIVELVVGDESASLYADDDHLVLWRDENGYYCDSEGRRFSRSYPNPYKGISKRYRGLRFHGLRHTHFSLRRADGVDTSTILELAGWEDSRMLDRIYGHALEERLWATAGFMDNLVMEGQIT